MYDIFKNLKKNLKKGEAACNTLGAGTGGLEREEREEREKRDKETERHA